MGDCAYILHNTRLKDDEMFDIEELRTVRSNPILMRTKRLVESGVMDYINSLDLPTEWKVKEKLDWAISGNNTKCKCCDSSYAKPNSLWCSVSCMNKDPSRKAVISAKNKSNASARNKAREATTKARYGVSHISQLASNADKIRKTRGDKDRLQAEETMRKYFPDGDLYSHDFWAEECSKHASLLKMAATREIQFSYLHRWWKRIGFDAPFLKSSSGGEREMATWLQDEGVVFYCNDRTKLAPTKMEIDIYIPSHNIGIEYDGLYWHKNEDMAKKQNIAKENGIGLIRVFEDEWEEKSQIVKSIILSKLGIYKTRYYAKQTRLKKVSSTTAREFMNNNHIEGFAVAKQHIGLFVENVCVAMVSIGQSRFNKSETELIRFASLLNTQVVGGLSKLIKGIPNLYTYANKRYSPQGAAYGDFGQLIGETKPGYFWVVKGKRVNRFACQKHKLEALLGVSVDITKTETIIMEEHGHYRVFDCGHWKYRLS